MDFIKPKIGYMYLTRGMSLVVCVAKTLVKNRQSCLYKFYILTAGKNFSDMPSYLGTKSAKWLKFTIWQDGKSFYPEGPPIPLDIMDQLPLKLSYTKLWLL